MSIWSDHWGIDWKELQVQSDCHRAKLVLNVTAIWNVKAHGCLDNRAT